MHERGLGGCCAKLRICLCSFPGLTVCAKSGTGEVGGGKKPNAMFAGFVDDEAYPLAFIVAVEDGGYGKATCVPILSQVLAVCKEVMDDK